VADTDCVRNLSLVSLLVTLAVVAFLWTRSAQDSGLTSSSNAPDDAAKVTAAFSLQQTVPALQAWFAQAGTYAGATLPPSYGVTLVRADASSFCIQAGTEPSIQHLTGPAGNAPVDGPC
jgi:hypothetical protein